MRRRFAKDELFGLGSQRVFSGASLDQIVFPLGGIGTGSVGLMGTGNLTDWEIFNRPNFGGRLPKTFPILWAKESGKAPACRVIEAPVLPPHTGDGGGGPQVGRRIRPSPAGAFGLPDRLRPAGGKAFRASRGAQAVRAW